MRVPCTREACVRRARSTAGSRVGGHRRTRSQLWCARSGPGAPRRRARSSRRCSHTPGSQWSRPPSRTRATSSHCTASRSHRLPLPPSSPSPHPPPGSRRRHRRGSRWGTLAGHSTLSVWTTAATLLRQAQKRRWRGARGRPARPPGPLMRAKARKKGG